MPKFYRFPWLAWQPAEYRPADNPVADISAPFLCLPSCLQADSLPDIPYIFRHTAWESAPAAHAPCPRLQAGAAAAPFLPAHRKDMHTSKLCSYRHSCGRYLTGAAYQSNDSRMRTAVFPQPLHWKAAVGACAAASADACRPWAVAASFCFPAAVQAEQRR